MNHVNRTLLIDDDKITNFINERLIKKLNITSEIKIANNGAEALEIIHNGSNVGQVCPELIFLDINMPVMDGFDFLNEFKKLDFSNKSQVKIVMLTTSSSPKDMERIKLAGVAGYINKPLTEEKIRYILSQRYVDSEL